MQSGDLTYTEARQRMYRLTAESVGEGPVADVRRSADVLRGMVR